MPSPYFILDFLYTRCIILGVTDRSSLLARGANMSAQIQKLVQTQNRLIEGICIVASIVFAAGLGSTIPTLLKVDNHPYPMPTAKLVFSVSIIGVLLTLWVMRGIDKARKRG